MRALVKLNVHSKDIMTPWSVPKLDSTGVYCTTGIVLLAMRCKRIMVMTGACAWTGAGAGAGADRITLCNSVEIWTTKIHVHPAAVLALAR